MIYLVFNISIGHLTHQFISSSPTTKEGFTIFLCNGLHTVDYFCTGKILWEDFHWISFVCVAHRLQNVVKYAIEKQCMQKLLAKCRHLVGRFKHSAVATESLLKKQKTLGFKKPIRVVQEVAKRWNSTFFIMHRLVQLKQPMQLCLVDTINEEEVKTFDLTDHQWSVMKSILSLLEAVDQITTILSGERYSTLFWCLPLLFGLR